MTHREKKQRSAEIIRLQNELLDNFGHVRQELARSSAQALVTRINALRAANGWQPLDMSGRRRMDSETAGHYRWLRGMDRDSADRDWERGLLTGEEYFARFGEYADGCLGELNPDLVERTRAALDWLCLEDEPHVMVTWANAITTGQRVTVCYTSRDAALVAAKDRLLERWNNTRVTVDWHEPHARVAERAAMTEAHRRLVPVHAWGFDCMECAVITGHRMHSEALVRAAAEAAGDHDLPVVTS